MSSKIKKVHAWPYVLLWCAVELTTTGLLSALFERRTAVPLGFERGYNPVFYPLALLALSASTCFAAGLYLSQARGRAAVVKFLRGAARVIAVVVAFSLPVFVIATVILLFTQRMNSMFYQLLVLYAGEAALVAGMMRLSTVLAGSGFGREVAFLRRASVDDTDDKPAWFIGKVANPADALKKAQERGTSTERKVPREVEGITPPSMGSPAAVQKSSRQAWELSLSELLVFHQ